MSDTASTRITNYRETDDARSWHETDEDGVTRTVIDIKGADERKPYPPLRLVPAPKDPK